MDKDGEPILFYFDCCYIEKGQTKQIWVKDLEWMYWNYFLKKKFFWEEDVDLHKRNLWNVLIGVGWYSVFFTDIWSWKSWWSSNLKTESLWFIPLSNSVRESCDWMFETFENAKKQGAKYFYLDSTVLIAKRSLVSPRAPNAFCFDFELFTERILWRTRSYIHSWGQWWMG